MRKLSKLLKSHFVPGLDLGQTVKFSEGTIRSRTLAETFAAIHRHLPLLNVTRIIDLTPLDNLGLPVFSLCIPSLVGESFCCGKGLSREAALVSAFMEAYEYRAFDVWNRHMVAASTFSEIGKKGKALNPGKIEFPHEEKISRSSKYDWIKCIELFEGEEVYLPADLLSVISRSSSEVTRINQFANTNGMASGNSIMEAILHGIFERIERDAKMLASLRQSLRLEFDPEQLSPKLAACFGRLAEAGVQCHVFDISTDVGIPVYSAYLVQECGIDSYFIHGGQGCHLNPEIALSRAVTEAIQVRLTYFSGSREDVGSGTVDRQIYETLMRNYQNAPVVSFESGGGSHTSFFEMLTLVKRRLSVAGFRKIYVADISFHLSDLACVSVFIPGLEALTLDENDAYLMGKRAARIYKKSGGVLFQGF